MNCDDEDGDVLQYTIQEHQPKDATLNVTSSGTIVVNSAYFLFASFIFLRLSRTFKSLLRIHTDIFIQEPLDFENQPFYRVKVSVSDGQWSETVSVAMFVTDVNEGAPEFSSSGKNIVNLRGALKW